MIAPPPEIERRSIWKIFLYYWFWIQEIFSYKLAFSVVFARIFIIQKKKTSCHPLSNYHTFTFLRFLHDDPFVLCAGRRLVCYCQTLSESETRCLKYLVDLSQINWLFITFSRRIGKNRTNKRTHVSRDLCVICISSSLFLFLSFFSVSVIVYHSLSISREVDMKPYGLTHSTYYVGCNVFKC